jgi:hypothetical protein
VNRQDQQRFDEIRHRLERVTPGPWTVQNRTTLVAMPGTPEDVDIADCDPWNGLPMVQNVANADFLAHSLDDIVWLTERVRDLERQAKGQASECD